MPSSTPFKTYGIRAMALLAGLILAAGCGKEGPSTLEDAQKSLAIQQFDDALAHFENVSETTADDNTRALALYGMGQVWQHRRPGEDFERARELYRRVLKELPETDVAPTVHLALARSWELDYQNPDLEKARTLYREIVETRQGAEAATRAKLRLAMSYIEEMSGDSAARGAEMLEEWVEENPESTYRAAVYLVLGRVYLYPLEDEQKALQALLKADEVGIYSYSLNADLYYRIADIAHYAFEEPRVEIARKYYNKLRTEHEDDPRGFIAKKRLVELENALEGSTP